MARVDPPGVSYDRKLLEEGDSPAFFNIVKTGLRTHRGWLRWTVKPGNLWIDARKDDDYTKPLWRIMPQSSGFIMLMS